VNDINFLKGISRILLENGENVLDLGQLEDDGKIIFIPCGGTNLAHWASRLANLNRPEFHLFDRDVGSGEVSRNQAVVDEINSRDDCKALLTGKKEMENYLHPSAISTVQPQISVTFGDFDDVPLITACNIHEQSGSDKGWDDLQDTKRKKKISRAKQWLNTSAVQAMTPALLDQQDPSGDVRGWFSIISQFLQDE